MKTKNLEDKMTKGEDPSARCVGCGKVIEPRTRSARIQLGVENPEAVLKAEEAEMWGAFHEKCFFRAVQSPNIAMLELRRAAGVDLC